MPSLRELAEDAGAWMPLRAGITRYGDDRYHVLASNWPHVNVWRLRLEPDEVGPVLEEVRGFMRAHGKARALWWVGESATPADLAERLLGEGLVPDPDAPDLMAMALSSSPPPAETDLLVKRVDTFEEFSVAQEIDWECNRVAEEDRVHMRRRLADRWERMAADSRVRYYIAYDGDRPVAAARAMVGDDAGYLLGGATLPHARGRGAYRALVEVRWRDAVEAGAPALVVQAGEMSAPILEGLGFEPLARIRVLADRISDVP